MHIEEMTIGDYDEVLSLWRSTEGIGLSAADEPGPIEAYLRRNPGSSFVAREGGRVLGAVLCGHDGRRGYLYHLAVAPEARGKGVGKALIGRGIAELTRQGIQKCHVFVIGENQAGRGFWASREWSERKDLLIFSKEISTDPPQAAG